MFEVDITIRPNEKYRYVVEGESPTEPAVDPDGDGTDPRANPSIPEDEKANRFGARETEPPEEWDETADAFTDVVAATPSAEDFDLEPEDVPLSWEHFSVASDPDLLAKIATYFEGMDPDEPTGRLRAKCRLLDPEAYANAQLAAREELRE